MVKIMDIPDPRGRGSFWEAYRACAEENRVRPDRSAFYVNWARDFANFLPEKPFPKQCMYGTGSREHPASVFLLWQNVIKKGYTRQDI
jgi:hypothetical protein